jgi:hypothetical protein
MNASLNDYFNKLPAHHGPRKKKLTNIMEKGKLTVCPTIKEGGYYATGNHDQPR